MAIINTKPVGRRSFHLPYLAAGTFLLSQCPDVFIYTAFEDMVGINSGSGKCTVCLPKLSKQTEAGSGGSVENRFVI